MFKMLNVISQSHNSSPESYILKRLGATIEKKPQPKRTFLRFLIYNKPSYLYVVWTTHYKLHTCKLCKFKKNMQIYLSYETKTIKLSLTNTYDLLSTVKRKLFHISILCLFDLIYFLFYLLYKNWIYENAFETRFF